MVERSPIESTSVTPEPVTSSNESSKFGVLLGILGLMLLFLGGYFILGGEENLEKQMVLEPNAENTISSVPLRQKITESVSAEKPSVVKKVNDGEEERHINSCAERLFN